MGGARNIYLTQPMCLASIEQWISVRLRRAWGVSSEIKYRGLRPESRLVITQGPGNRVGFHAPRAGEWAGGLSGL